MTVIVIPEAIPLPLLVNPCVFIHKLGIQNSPHPHCTVVPGQLIATAPFFLTAGYSKNQLPKLFLYCLLIIYICPISLALFKPRLSFKNNPNIYCPLKILYFFTQLLIFRLLDRLTVPSLSSSYNLQLEYYFVLINSLAWHNFYYLPYIISLCLSVFLCGVQREC